MREEEYAVVERTSLRSTLHAMKWHYFLPLQKQMR